MSPGRRPRLGVVLLLLAGLSVSLSGACGGDDEEGRGDAGPPRPDTVRDCTSHVEGKLPSDWRRRSVIAGPVAFVYAREFANYDDGSRQRWVDEKTLVVVEAGRKATVAVPLAERRHVSLHYDLSRRGRRPQAVDLADGVGVVRFEACEPDARPFTETHSLERETQFNGGIVVRWPRCAPLDVYVGGSSKPLRRVISFGAGDCRSAPKGRPKGRD